MRQEITTNYKFQYYHNIAKSRKRNLYDIFFFPCILGKNQNQHSELILRHVKFLTYFPKFSYLSHLLAKYRYLVDFSKVFGSHIREETAFLNKFLWSRVPQSPTATELHGEWEIISDCVKLLRCWNCFFFSFFNSN